LIICKIEVTTDWAKYEVVLFVPQEATSISYGVLLINNKFGLKM
jgi:hypothetical protein